MSTGPKFGLSKRTRNPPTSSSQFIPESNPAIRGPLDNMNPTFPDFRRPVAGGWLILAILLSGGKPPVVAPESSTSAPAIAGPQLLSPDDDLTAEEMEWVRAAETGRIQVINQVIGSVVAVYDPHRQGGGSGVIIDPSGIALTNHHVIQGAGLHGLGGLSDGQLYQWDLIGTDPGGDVALIQMKGRDAFPFAPLGDSDRVRVGDWALAMGNPFLLAHDQVPTVTLGVVSGTERFQEGAGSNQLVYGNCIQIDSSINPGNSGGPLFNMQGEVIGINGRGSFRDRGRVNVGLGYAISSNQIRNFIPDLLATRIVEHGTLDASFSNRDAKVVCSTLNLDAPVARAGLQLGDELVEFEGRPIQYANQFKNLICTLPEDWPATLRIRKPDGSEHEFTVRLFGLPYNFQPDQRAGEDGGRPSPEPDPNPNKGGEDEPRDEPGQDPGPEQPPPDAAAAEALRAFLLQEAGVVTNETVNTRNALALLKQWTDQAFQPLPESPPAGWQIQDEIRRGAVPIGEQTITLSADGRFHVVHRLQDQSVSWMFDGQDFWQQSQDETKKLTLIEAKTSPVLMQAAALIAPVTPRPLEKFGRIILDGGDKAAGRIASRVMFLDPDDDWLYGWFSLGDEEGRPRVRLCKFSSHRDCLGTGGMLHSRWERHGGLLIPRRKDCIRGLDESVVWTAHTVSCNALATLDESLFRIDEDRHP